MTIKILKSSSINFEGVNYNDRKINKGSGELLTMKNFPSHINQYSNQQEVRNYLKLISSRSKTKSPQFHAVLSTRYRDNSKDELNQIAKEWLSEMGYKNQPYLIVFHNDTDNNHVHIVSTRVDKTTGKKINDSYEKFKAQKALKTALINLNLQDRHSEEKLLKKLLSYNYSNSSQLKLLLKENGFSLIEKDHKVIVQKSNGFKQDITSEIQFRPGDGNKRKQLKAILNKYKDTYSNKVFKIIDDRDVKEWQKERQAKIKTDYYSELQNFLKVKFGLEIIFHKSENNKPFGYTVIDHKNKTIWKGSELMKLNELFLFTDIEIKKKDFERLNNFNITDDEKKSLLIDYFRSKGVPIEGFMLYEKSKSYTEEAAEIISNSTSSEGVFINENQFFVGTLKEAAQSIISEIDKSMEELLDPTYINSDEWEIGKKKAMNKTKNKNKRW